jgi:hypothetical protein
MAEAHSFRRALHLELDGAAKAIAPMYDHVSSPCSRRRRGHALFSLVAALSGMIARSHFLIAPPAFGLLHSAAENQSVRPVDQASGLLDRASRRCRTLSHSPNPSRLVATHR